ncbi:hypothetical protein E5Q_02906 [Mixia osmundae IAM 14324]|uniref:Band 7 domain-containing protein n=1 Tax=Mixia osmundae (strain CBS 9802 / IAM 14324 / JCM 22182 / KY 12970) TaxID=764103 RepID=G7E082_MIXOS|nr:hypothetical protein E5Q_02906 [Mixia osmundae IAM 14324]
MNGQQMTQAAPLHKSGEDVPPARPTGTTARAQAVKTQDRTIVVEPLKRSEMQQSYAQVMADEHTDHGAYGSFVSCLGSMMGSLGAIPICFCCPNPYVNVQQGTVALVSRFGKFYRSVDPGLVKVNPMTESINIVDIRVQLLNIPRQTVTTYDSVNIEIDSVLYFHINNPYVATFSVANVRNALIERAQTTLRQIAGGRTLQSMITEREAVANEVSELVDAVSETWGLVCLSLLIKDIHFSADLQQSLSSAAAAKRIGESKVIAAKAEVDAAKLMREAADILNSQAALQIRQLEAYQSIARTANTKVLFLPMGNGMSTPHTSTSTSSQPQPIIEDIDDGQENGIRTASQYAQLSQL